VLRHYFASRIQEFERYLPLLAVSAIILIIAIITALNADQLSHMAVSVLLAVILHNTLGLLIGYLTARKMGYSVSDCRTLAIEVGMQNSGLAVALAIKHFSAAAALPGAVFSIWHNISGSLLAGFWARSRENS
jgi:BASS family bile acid:Na+ symporter